MIETRNLLLADPKVERRAGGFTVTGIGVPWNSPAIVNTQSGQFIESWEPGALDEQARNGWSWGIGGSNRSVLSLLNHDPNRVLGSVVGGSLRLNVTEAGLRYSLDLPESAADVAEGVGRGDIGGASVSFTSSNDLWGMDPDGDIATRRIVTATLMELSLCAWPVYTDSSAMLAAQVVSGAIIQPTVPRSVPVFREQRVGKTISKATAKSLQDVHDSLVAAALGLRDLIEVGKTGAPEDSDVLEEESIGAALAEAAEDSKVGPAIARSSMKVSEMSRDLRARVNRQKRERVRELVLAGYDLEVQTRLAKVR